MLRVTRPLLTSTDADRLEDARGEAVCTVSGLTFERDGRRRPLVVVGDTAGVSSGDVEGDTGTVAIFFARVARFAGGSSTFSAAALLARDAAAGFVSAVVVAVVGVSSTTFFFLAVADVAFLVAVAAAGAFLVATAFVFLVVAAFFGGIVSVAFASDDVDAFDLAARAGRDSSGEDGSGAFVAFTDRRLGAMSPSVAGGEVTFAVAGDCFDATGAAVIASVAAAAAAAAASAIFADSSSD